jgi:hypothetical protein
MAPKTRAISTAQRQKERANFMGPIREGYLHGTNKRGLSSWHQKETAPSKAPNMGLFPLHHKERAIFAAPKRQGHLYGTKRENYIHDTKERAIFTAPKRVDSFRSTKKRGRSPRYQMSIRKVHIQKRGLSPRGQKERAIFMAPKNRAIFTGPIREGYLHGTKK